MTRTIQVTLALFLLALLLIKCNVIWMSPKSYKHKQAISLEPPVMTLEEYTSTGLIDKHARPFVFTINSKNGKGAVLAFGVEHTYDPNHRQFATMKSEWEKFKPTVAMVEGRLDLIMKWFFNPVKASGEGGYTQTLAKSDGISIYSWEPGKDAEIKYVLEKADAMHVAMFYCLRRFANKWDQFSTEEQNNTMQRLIREHDRYELLKGALKTVEQVDSLWKADLPQLPSWRSYKHPRNGWPEGKFEMIADRGNAVRDDYMCKAIIEMVRNGERVYVSMGSSHAVRIEQTLRAMIE